MQSPPTFQIDSCPENLYTLIITSLDSDYSENGKEGMISIDLMVANSMVFYGT